MQMAIPGDEGDMEEGEVVGLVPPKALPAGAVPGDAPGEAPVPPDEAPGDATAPLPVPGDGEVPEAPRADPGDTAGDAEVPKEEAGEDEPAGGESEANEVPGEEFGDAERAAEETAGDDKAPKTDGELRDGEAEEDKTPGVVAEGLGTAEGPVEAVCDEGGGDTVPSASAGEPEL